MRGQNKISKLLLDRAKNQFYNGEIMVEEYREILYLIFNKLSEVEDNLSRTEYLLNYLKKDTNLQTNLIDTINYSLAMN